MVSMLGSDWFNVTGWLDSAFYRLMNGFWFVIYSIWVWLAYVVDVIEDMFYVLAGLKSIAGDGINKSAPDPSDIKNSGAGVSDAGGNAKSMDIVGTLINNTTVQTVFQNLIIVAIVLLMFFTVLQIIREQYLKKDGGNPYMTVFKMFKGMITMLFITAVVLVGLYTSGVVLKALHKATGGTEGGGISGVVFKTMSYNANRLRAGGPASSEFGISIKEDQLAKISRSGTEKYAGNISNKNLRNKILPHYTFMENAVYAKGDYAVEKMLNGDPIVECSIGIEVGGSSPFRLVEYTYTWQDPASITSNSRHPGYLWEGAAGGRKDVTPETPTKYWFNKEDINSLPRGAGFNTIGSSGTTTASFQVPNYSAGKGTGFTDKEATNDALDKAFDILIDDIINFEVNVASWGGRSVLSHGTRLPTKFRYDTFFDSYGKGKHPNITTISPDGNATQHVQSFTVRLLSVTDGETVNPEFRTLQENKAEYENFKNDSLEIFREYGKKGTATRKALSSYKNVAPADKVDEFFCKKPDGNAGNNYLIEWIIFEDSGKVFYISGYKDDGSPIYKARGWAGYYLSWNPIGYFWYGRATPKEAGAGMLAVVGDAPVSYRNVHAVDAYYYAERMTYFIGFLAILICISVFLNFAIGLIQRLMEMVILYIMSPITLAMYPFDDGGAFKSQFMQPFYRKVISVYAVILSLNLFFLLWPVFQKIQFFPTWAQSPDAWTGLENVTKNLTMSMLMTIALLGMLPKIRNQIQGMLGADAVEEKSIKQGWADANKATGGALNTAAWAAKKGVVNSAILAAKWRDYTNPDKREADRRTGWIEQNEARINEKTKGMDDKAKEAAVQKMYEKDMRNKTGIRGWLNPMAYSRAGMAASIKDNATALGKAMFDMDNGALMQGSMGNFVRNTFDKKTIKDRRKKLMDAEEARELSNATGWVEAIKAHKIAAETGQAAIREYNAANGTQITSMSEMTEDGVNNAKANSVKFREEISKATFKIAIEHLGGEDKAKEQLAKVFKTPDEVNAAMAALNNGGKTADGKDFDFKDALGERLSGAVKSALTDGQMGELHKMRLETMAEKDTNGIMEGFMKTLSAELKGTKNKPGTVAQEDFATLTTAVKAYLGGDEAALDNVEFITKSNDARGKLQGAVTSYLRAGLKDKTDTGLAHNYYKQQVTYGMESSYLSAINKKAVAGEKLQVAYDKAVAGQHHLRVGGMSQGQIDNIMKLYGAAYGVGSEIMRDNIDLGKVDEATIRSWGYTGVIGEGETLKNAIKEKYMDWAKAQHSDAISKINATKFENYDISMKFNQRIGALMSEKIIEEEIKLDENSFSSILPKYSNIILQNPLYQKAPMTPGGFRDMSEQLRIARQYGINDSRVSKDLKDDAEFVKMLATNEGRANIELFERMMSSIGVADAVQSNRLVMNADNIRDMIKSKVYLEKFKNLTESAAGQFGQGEARAQGVLDSEVPAALKRAKEMAESTNAATKKMGEDLVKALSGGIGAYYNKDNNQYVENYVNSLSKQLETGRDAAGKKLEQAQITFINGELRRFEAIFSNRAAIQKSSDGLTSLGEVRGILNSKLDYLYRLFLQSQSGS